MTERERLTELIMNTPEIPVTINGRAQGRTYQTARNIADHLLSNGVIVPPCKVGDTVYVCLSRTRVIECKVARIIIERIEEIGMSFICYGGMRFDMRHWGKTVFLTREEAEKALEGMQ
jgi:hypothetical protein